MNSKINKNKVKIIIKKKYKIKVVINKIYQLIEIHKNIIMKIIKKNIKMIYRLDKINITKTIIITLNILEQRMKKIKATMPIKENHHSEEMILEVEVKIKRDIIEVEVKEINNIWIEGIAVGKMKIIIVDILRNRRKRIFKSRKILRL
jgi:hypothetical protein